MSARARWQDIEPVRPGAFGPGGKWRIFCAGGCDLARERGYIPIMGHQYLFHTKTSALAEWRREHPRNTDCGVTR